MTLTEATAWEMIGPNLKDIVEREAWPEGERLFAAANGRMEARPESVQLVRWQDLPKPEPRRWVVTNWIPSGCLTLLTGAGGYGKSMLALQLAAAVAGGKPGDWIVGASAVDLGTEETGTAVFASWEDDGPEIARRLAASSIGGKGATPDAPLYLAVLRGRGPLWQAPSRYAVADETPLAFELQAAVNRLDKPPALVVLDSLAAIYADSEIDRRSVRAFLAWLDKWAEQTGAAVLIVAHPPKTAGVEYSGSTDWLAGVRAMLSLTREPHGKKPPKGPDNRPLAWKLASVKTSYAAPPDAVKLERVPGRDGFRWTAADCWEPYDDTA